MRSSLWIFSLICALCTVPPGTALAETSNEEVVSELKEMKKALQAQNELIWKQQAKIEELERRVASSPLQATQPSGTSTAGLAPVPSTPVRTGSLVPGQIGAVLPEIGVVGDIVATGSESKSDAEGNNRISAREVELVLGNYVDPYSRYDATISFSDFEEVGLEEAYLTRWGLPLDLKGRFGRFFPRIGKAAAMHRDSLDTVDEPLVVRRYFGTEGLTRAGLDFTKPLEGPFGLVLEPSAGVLEGGTGEGGTMFGSTRRRPTFYEHLKTFKELTDTSNLELGLTHLVGSKDEDARFEVNALGIDATYLNYLTPTNKLKLQSELYIQDRKETIAIDDTTGETTQFDRHPWGAYVLTDYRFAPRWSAGARADHVRLVDTAASRHADQGLSAWLTFYQSEFARWRLQFEHTERASAKTEDAVMLQGTFAIGTHKHSLQ